MAQTKQTETLYVLLIVGDLHSRKKLVGWNSNHPKSRLNPYVMFWDDAKGHNEVHFGSLDEAKEAAEHVKAQDNSLLLCVPVVSESAEPLFEKFKKAEKAGMNFERELAKLDLESAKSKAKSK